MKPTIKDIAELSGYSITTVSMVLNNTDHPIKESTKKKVWDAAEKLNYIPNQIAKSLVTKKTFIIAMIVPDISNPYYPELAKWVIKRANSRGYNVVLIDLDNSNNLSHLNILKSGILDGALIVTRRLENISREYKEKYNIKTVTMYEQEDDDESYQVTVDNEYGGYLATKHLIKLGHRKIGFISGPENTPHSNRRFKGVKRAMKEENIPISKNLIYYGDYTFESGYKGVRSFKEDFTAIFAFNDLTAYGAIKALDEDSKIIPEDVSVIGFDNIQMTEYTNPRLTTINQPVKNIGEKAIDLLISQIENEAIDRRQIFFKPSVVNRGTTGIVKWLK